MNVDDRTALVGLSALWSMGPQRLTAILARHDPADAFARLASGHRLAPDVERSAPSALFERLRAQAAALDLARVVGECEAHAISVLARGDDEFPPALAADPHPPSVLFVRGRLDVLAARRVAIVGTRNATAAGRATAHELGAELGSHDVAVVSGLARGIDGAAHRGVRSVAGRAVGVVGNGLDHPYPKQNADIWRWVSEHGLLLSEWPPGTDADAWRFPARNRIIAALCEVLVVVESRDSGGSLITAKDAADRGITVMAVPGSPRSPAAAGTNKLLVDGAGPVTCVDDVLVALGLDHSRDVTSTLSTGSLDERRSAVLKMCAERPCTLDVLATALGISATEAAIAASQLEELGLVVDTGGWFESTGSRLAGSKDGTA